MKKCQSLSINITEKLRNHPLISSAYKKSWSEKLENLQTNSSILENFLEFYFEYLELRAYSTSYNHKVGNIVSFLDISDFIENDFQEENAEEDLKILIENFNLCFQEIRQYIREDFHTFIHIKKVIDSNCSNVLASPQVAIICEEFPDSKIAKNFNTFIKKYPIKEVLNLLAKTLKKRKPRNFWKSIQYLKQLLRYYVHTYKMFKFLNEPVDEKYYGIIPIENLDKINYWYYSSRGTELYEDFSTFADSSNDLSSANALHFLHNSKKLISLNVLECGIGNGKFGIDFLNELKKTEIYNTTTYEFCDFSAKLLKQVENSINDDEALKKHCIFRKLDFSNFKLSHSIDLFRFHELLDDIGNYKLIYKKNNQEYFEIKPKFYLKNPTKKAKQTYDYLIQGKREICTHEDIIKTLRQLSWNASLKKLDIEHYPYKEILMQITKNKQDILFGFNYGALEGIEKVFNTLNYDNKIFIFDYGSFNSPKEHYQSYFYLSGIYRKYGGSITVDVNFDAIIALAQSYGLTTQIWSQEEYVSKWLNFTAISNVKKIDNTTFVP